MKVSIVTATYNSSSTILDTVLSVEKQTYPNIEYIIIDGDSQDGTIKIAKNNCSRISKILVEKDEGIYDALNKGISLSTGDVVGFLHSDDLYSDDTVVEELVSKFESSKYDAVYGDLKYVKKLDTSIVVRSWEAGEFDFNKLKNGWMPPHPTFYMKRDLYLKYGAFDIGFKISGDYDSMMRYLWRYKIKVGYLPRFMVEMRYGGESNRSLKNIVLKTLEDVRVLRANKIQPLRAILLKNIRKLPQFFS